MKNTFSIQSPDKKVVKGHETGVLLHLYYPEMWDEMRSFLSNLGEHFDLFVTIPYNVDFSEDLVTANYPNAYIYRCENRGRDVAPFLSVFLSISHLGYQYLCKVHTKRDTPFTTTIGWRQDMLQKLLGSPEIIKGIKTAFDKNPDWGMIAPQGHVVPSSYYWSQNATRVTGLARSIGIPTDKLEFSYVAGTMFWFQPKAFNLLLKANFSFEEFIPEQNQQDGTLAHAFERFFGLGVTYAGYQIAESGSEGVRPANVSFHLHVLSRIFEDQQETIFALEKENLARGEHILLLKNHIETRDQDYQARGQHILVLEDHIRNLEQEHQAQGQHILVLEDHIHNLEQEHQAQGQHSLKLEEHVRMLDLENQQSTALIESIYRSSSWRVTFPLRIGKDFLQKVARLLLRMGRNITNDLGSAQTAELSSSLPAEHVVSDPRELSAVNRPMQNLHDSQPARQIQPLQKTGDRFKISVIVTAYNHEKYIQHCIDSILMQKGDFDLEVILGDDCSTDETPEIMQKFQEQHPDIITILPREANLGVTRNLKRCLDTCTGEFIAICEGDDYWVSEDKLQKQMEFLEKHTEYPMCFSSILLLEEDGHRLIPHHEQYMLNKDSLFTDDLIEINYIGNFSCCMYRADVIKEFPAELFDMYTVDWMFNIVCSEWGKIGYIRDWMSVYRLHSNGGWTGKSNREKLEDLLKHIDTYNRFLNYKYDTAFRKLRGRISLLLDQEQIS